MPKTSIDVSWKSSLVTKLGLTITIRLPSCTREIGPIQTNHHWKKFAVYAVISICSFFSSVIAASCADRNSSNGEKDDLSLTVASGGSPKRGVRSKNSQGSPLWLRRGPKQFIKGGVLPFFARTKFRGGPRPLGPNGSGATGH